MNGRVKDRTGQKSNRLTFKSYAYTKNKKVYWNVVCGCGNKKVIRSDSKVKSCGCLLKEVNTGRRLGYKQISDKEFIKNSILSSQRSVYKTYSDGNLSFEDFLNLSSKNCYYCNKPPSNKTNIYIKQDGTHKTRKKKNKNGDVYITQMSFRECLSECYFIYNGLDRIDQTLPHDKENIIPCCSECNYMKRNMSKNDLVEKIKEIYSWITQKNLKN